MRRTTVRHSAATRRGQDYPRHSERSGVARDGQLAIEGVCYLVNSFVDFLAPGFANTVLAILMVSGLAEVLLCLWLLVKGVNVAKWREVVVRV
jgi:Domain of unknown function (DUF4386)